MHKRFETELILTNNHPGWYVCPDMFVESVKVNALNLSKIKNTHTATNINTYYIGDYLVSKVTGEPDDTPGSGVNVGHDTYFLVGEDIYRK